MVRNEGDRLTKAVICTPRTEFFDIKEPEQHNIDEVADHHQAIQQHGLLCRIMQDHDTELLDIKEMPGHPNSVFTRDTCICTPRGYIMPRMGLASRRGEEQWMGEFLKTMGENKYGTIHEPGTLEGGDCILAGDVAFIGQSQRSNEAGIQQLKELLLSIGYDIRIATVPPPRLHIGGMMSMVGKHRVLCCKKLFPEGFFEGFNVVPIPAETFISGNAICLNESVVIVEKKNVAAINSLRDNGVHVYDIDLSEFVKGRGGPTCLIMPLERGSDM